MKTKSAFLLLLLLSTVIASCSKNSTKPEQQEADFFSNPKDYALFIRYNNNSIALLEFRDNNRIYESNIIQDDDMITYVKVDAHTIDIPDRNIRIKRSGVELPANVKEHYLVKKTEQNGLAGNTYEGSYLRQDGSVLHQNFFYTFGANNSDNLAAGFIVGTPVRNEKYTLFANMAARVSKVTTQGDTEYMIALGDKLYVSYSTYGQSTMHYGVFTKK